MKVSELERMMEAKNRGWSYNPETGLVVSGTGHAPTGRNYRIGVKTGEKYEYIKCTISMFNKNRGFMSHRFAYWYMTGVLPLQVDHIEHCEDPVYMNRFDNLRASNNQRNQFNRPDVRGYFFCNHHKKWRAKITLNRKSIFLGYFKTEDEAREAYLSAKKIYHI